MEALTVIENMVIEPFLLFVQEEAESREEFSIFIL